MSLSQELVAHVDGIMKSSALVPRNGFHLEPRCRVCRNDVLRKRVNDLLATGASFAMIVRALGEDNAELDKCDRVTVDSIRNHTARHFPVQNVAKATYREILERRARANGVDFVEGVATALTPIAFFETVMVKSYETLVDSDTKVDVNTGIVAAGRLQSLIDSRDYSRDLLMMKVQLAAICDAVKSTVPHEMWGEIVEKLDELEEQIRRRSTSARTPLMTTNPTTRSSTRTTSFDLRRACRLRRRSARWLRSRCVRGTSDLRVRHFPFGSIAAQLPSPTTDRIPLSVASERTGWTAERVLYRGRTVVLKVRVSPDLIAGDVDEGYGKVADVFRRNLTSGQEVGAAVAVYRDGVKVVDLWGGFRNGITKAPWEQDTLALMFSTTKGVSALAVAVAASQGLISYDARVADYWPEFAQASKGAITVRQLLCHQAGLPALDPAPTLDDVSDPAKLSAMLAAQAPAWTPGSRHGYHAVTLGWYESELIRHADPAGRSLGQFFADEVATPLGLDFHIGLPASVDRDRVAHVHCWSHAEVMLHLNAMPMRLVAASFNPRSLTSRAFTISKGLKMLDDWNRDDFRAVEIPASNGIGTARSVAKAYGSVATGGSDLGLAASTLDELIQPATPPTHGMRDKVLHVDTVFSLGYIKPFLKFVFGSSSKAFGTMGFGGSFGCADPDTGIGFAYVMNRLGFHLWSDPRELALRQVLFYEIVGARSQT